MTSLAIDDNLQFTLIDWELEQDGPSYTLMTVKRLMDQENFGPQEIGLIIGEDLLGRLHEWHLFPELCSLVTWIIVRRSSGKLEKDIESRFPGVDFRYLSVDNIFLPVSSSEVRELVKSRKSFRYLVPQKVYAYIQQNSLYTATTDSDETEALRKKPTKSKEI
jgi:nicotinate-nucleotide adenylyltransferase